MYSNTCSFRIFSRRTGRLADSLVWLSRVEANLSCLPRSSRLTTNVRAAAVLAAVPYPNDELATVDNTSSSGTVVDIDRLSLDVVDLHTNLELLRHYQTKNVETFQEILRKYDRVSELFLS